MYIIKRIDDSISNNSNPILQKWCTCKKQKIKKKIERKRTHNLTKYSERERDRGRKTERHGRRESTQSRPTGKSSQFFSSAQSPEREKAFIAEHCYAARFIPNGQSL